MKKRLLSMLVLLMTVVTGAWAQEGTLLVTMTAGETVTYDPATATDVAEITMTGATQLGTWEDYYYGNHYSWLNSSWNDTDKGTLEVTAKPGYTITKVVFSGSDIAGSPGSREVTASPFAVYPWGSGSAFGSAVYTSDSYTEIFRNAASNDILGIDKIEVYGYAGTPTPTGNGVKYALSVGDTFTSGQTVDVKDGNDVVATITYGESGGADFKAAKTDNKVSGYTAFTEGNGVNGNTTGGTFYTIVPKYDGTITVAVVLNAGKKFYVLEDGTALTNYNGITVDEKYYGTYSFEVSKDKAYKFYCAGSKLGFYGFEYTYASSQPEPQPTGDGVNYALSVGTNEHGTVTFKVGENTVTTAQEGQTVTVEITPATGWVVNQPSGQWYAAVAAARSQRTASVDLLDKVTLTPVEGQTNQWTFTMQRANVEISSTYKKLLTNTDITVADISALTYSGVSQTPTVTVKDGNTELVLNTDYTVSYSNNVNAALSTAETNAPTVTITAVATSEKYAGETTKKFTINKKALTVKADNKTVTFGDAAPTYTESYDGFVNNETKAVLGGTLALTCNYVKNQTGAGNYDITPSGLTSSNYDITFTKGTLTVGKKALENSFIADIQALIYNGLAQEPAPVVTFNGMTLVKGTDYSVAYSDNVNVGTATATVTALANSTKYSGSASKTFSITKKALTVTADNKSVTFGDEAPAYTVSYDGFAAQENKDVLGGTLALACDYVKDQSGVGNYTITPSGLTSSNYAITFANGTLTVGAKALENGFIADIDALTYTSLAQEPAPVVTFNGMTLVKGMDYTVAYSNNTNAGTATVTCTGQGNYSGQAQKTFTINPAVLTEATLKKTEFIYDAFDPQPQTAEVDVVKAGELIVPTTDYTVSDDTQTNLGDYKLTVTGKNNFQGSVKADYSIIKDDLPVTAEDTQSGEEVDNVTIQVSVETDTETGEKTVIVDQLDVTPATSSQQVTVEIPSQINGVPVASIGAGALSAATNVSDIYMPETGETPIEVTDASLQAGDGKAVVHAPLQLLDNYAKMLPSHVGEKKVVSEVTQTAKRFWSFSCGVDVELPEGVTANIVKANTESQVTSEPIKGNVVKANNGVLLEGYQGVEYTLTAMAATGVGNDYEGNLLEPVIEKKHYGYGQGYFILKDGKFYAIANDAAAIPSCKAVLHIAGANARVISIDFDEATSIHNAQFTIHNETGAIYDLNGRKLNGMPTKKGMYIMNGKKVVVK